MPNTTGGQPVPDDLNKVLDLETRRCVALGDGDLETLRAITAEEYRHIHANGAIDDRDAYFERLAASPHRQTTRGELMARRWGELSILTGPLTTVIRPDSRPAREISGIATNVYARTSEGWQHLHFQVTPWPTDR